MSITSDLKTYTDRVATQGKQALDTAQTQLNDVTGQANEFIGKARSNASDIADKAGEAAGELRASAEKAINLDAIKAAIEPYVSQVLGYTSQVTDRAESLYAEAKKDKRLAPFLERAEQAYDQVDALVVQPVLAATGLTSSRSATSPKTTTTSTARKPAASKPAAKKATVTKPAAKRTTTRATTRTTSRPAAKKTTTRKSSSS